ncbi:unnamed protein product [Tilletia controversa]|uniref:Uncharacterized protein n=1 Tax=Tilletia controversa TaxID=13291 RepID=A0A8X7SX53_9BASI|nr:hypothetical protein CF328_g3850 [Tilletia controversa]KAE8247293.1 hypothetical protein A4X06_0g4560 [Tilletia controversa]CAD6906686.1 unnamed protein product [Tilletia controversa]CAD6962836.1 unnamed protein product [Tilletia controversa]
MLGSPERRLFIVRIVRLCTILSCCLFFGGVVTQLKSDTHQASRATCDDTSSTPLPKRYLPTLIVSRIFLLFLILVVLLASVPLSNRARSTLSKLSFPLQGGAWAATDMAIGEVGRRSETLDADLQGDVSKLIGSAIIMLFASAQELSRRITHYLLVTAFLLASVGLFNLVAAILLYNPAYSGPFAFSKSTASFQHEDDDEKTGKSVLRERPSAPSYMHALSTSTVAAMQSFGNKAGRLAPPSGTGAGTAPHPMTFQAPLPPDSRTLNRVPVPTAMDEVPRPQTPPPVIQVTSPTPSVSRLNPLSPQLAYSSNGRHPFATDEALRLELHQPLAATFGLPVVREEVKTGAVSNVRVRGESDKDALIRMWTAQIAEQQRQKLGSAGTPEAIPVAVTPAPPTTGVGSKIVPAVQEPRLGGRMQITAPYLSLRETRALYAQRKAIAAAAAAAATAATASEAPATAPTTAPAITAPAISTKADEKPSPALNETFTALAKADELKITDQDSDSEDEGNAKMGDVPGLYVSHVHSAPKFRSMQGVLEHRRSSVPSFSHTNHEQDPHSGEEARDPFSSKAGKRGSTSSSSVSISISVSSSEDDGLGGSRGGRRARGRPHSLMFQSCSRLGSGSPDARASAYSCPSSPEGPPRSETTRWSRTSAGHTVRTAITGMGTVGFNKSSTSLRVPGSGGDGGLEVLERESRYLSVVLASIRRPSPRTSTVVTTQPEKQEQHLGPPSFVIPPLPPIPLSPVDSSSKTHPPISPLRSPGMVSQLQSAQEAALARAKARNKLRSLWLTRPVVTTSSSP